MYLYIYVIETFVTNLLSSTYDPNTHVVMLITSKRLKKSLKVFSNNKNFLFRVFYPIKK